MPADIHRTRTETVFDDFCSVGLLASFSSRLAPQNTAQVISFARAGCAVSGIEFDETRCAFLRHNVATAGVAADVLRGDAAAATGDGGDAAVRAALRRADLIFFDPPWGGPGVAAKPEGSVRLDLGGVDLAEICRRCGGAGFRARHALLKVPPNYDHAGLARDCSSVADVKVETAFRKMLLLVVSFKPRADASAEADADDAGDDAGGDAGDAPAPAADAPPGDASKKGDVDAKIWAKYT